jgi:hypothetical protein
MAESIGSVIYGKLNKVVKRKEYPLPIIWDTLQQHKGYKVFNKIPMFLKCSPDYSQEVMENIFHGVEDAEVYIHDIGAFSHSWDDHMALLCTILNKL